MKFKSFRILIIIITVILLYAAIKAKQEPVTIQMWDWYITQSAFLDNELKLFQQKYPNIKVKRVKQVSHRYKDLVNFAARSSTMPDVLAIPRDESVAWIRSGYFYPLNKWINREFIDRFPKGSFMSGINIFNGNYYSYPMVGSEYWCQFYLNASVFKKAGLVDRKGNPRYPKNWAEVRKFAKQITQKGKGRYYGFGLAYKPEHLHPNMFYEWARVAGARGGNQELHMGVDYKEGRYNFTRTEGFIKMFKLLLDLKKDKSLYPTSLSMDDETLRAKFADGEIAMIMGGVWNMTGWESTHPDFKDYDCVMIPPLDNKGYRALAINRTTGVWYGISATTKYPEESWKLLEWFAHPDVGARYVRAGLGISVFPSANVMANAKYKQMGQYLEISVKYKRAGPNPFARNPELANVVVRPVLPNHINVFWGIIAGVIKEEEIPEALKDLEDRLNKALEDGFADAIKKGYKVSMDDLKFPDWNPIEDYDQK